MTLATSFLYNSTHSCCCKFISLTFTSFVAGNGRQVINKWVGLPKLGGFDRTPRTPPGYGPADGPRDAEMMLFETADIV